VNGAAEEFERCITGGGVALFPADTVYGLACDPLDRAAVERLYALKRRPPDKAAAVMFFDLDAALSVLPELGERTRAAMRRLLPGPVTLLLPNPGRRFPLACAADPSTLGVRVADVPALAGVRLPALQSSANLSGGADARRVIDVPEEIRVGANLVIDGGELPGVPSTVVDLRRYEHGGIDAVSVVREGAISGDRVAEALVGQFHFNPATYLGMIREDFPEYDAFQGAVAAAASGLPVRSILELGTGTGETTRRLLQRFPEATLVGVDESEPMLAAARASLPADRVQLYVQRLQDPLPGGPFDLVASALSVHHLDSGEKADLFRRVRAVLRPGGRLVLGDVVVPADVQGQTTSLTPGYDKPSTVADQLRWLAEAGFEARVTWSLRDVVVIVARASR
jgi:tRNA threonylcarbamoyl adenosine modification protein (Sua5/YciO/YrdC/YwlC family)